MSIWTSKVRPALLCVTLAACAASPLLDRTTLSTNGQDVVIAAPARYCIDPATRDQGPRGATVFLVDCAPGAGGNQPAPLAAVLSASISNSGLPEGGLTGLREFLLSTAGQSLLGGGAAPTIHEARVEDRALLLLVSDGSGFAWRGFFEIHDRLIILSVSEQRAGVNDPTRSYNVMRAFITSIRAANGGKDA